MASTVTEIKRLKEALQKLRAQLIKAASPEEKEQVQKRIDWHQRTLEMMEG